ncbi:hypothetical protein, partial [Neisseria sicca]|uniref:hypothetical protein n=1 Tax=Neisseria sicca TaxID=490 RepID=UPI0011BD077C
MYVFEDGKVGVVFLDVLGVEEGDLEVGLGVDRGVFEGLDEGFVGLGEMDVFGDDGDFDGVFGIFDGMEDFFAGG